MAAHDTTHPKTRVRDAAAAPSPRLHGLDALRATALLLGILLHGLMPFVPGMGWMVADSRPTAWAMPTIAVIHLFRMVLFMLLAGYFARVVVTRRGMRRFLRERSVRIALPVVAFWPSSVLPLGLIAARWYAAHGLTLPALPNDPLLALSPGQLWFLWTLYQCCLILALVRWVAYRVAPAFAGRVLERMGRALVGRWGVALLAVPYLLTMLIQATTYAGIDEPKTLLPDPTSLLTYVTAFGAGWTLARRRGALQEIGPRWLPYLASAGFGSAVVLLVSGFLGVPVADGIWRMIGAGVAALTAWCWVYGLIGLCTTHLTSERFWVRYLADASYWMYLMHLPLLVALGALLTDAPWPAATKLAITLSATTALLLLTYDAFVRSTWIGRWLNGHRHPRALPPRVLRRSPALGSR